MPLLTNELLMRLTSAIDMFNAASADATDRGIPMSAPIPFFRMGEPFRIPVSPSSANDPFTIVLPPGANSFMYTNNNPFGVRLCGTQAGKTFRPVTATTGWLWMPGTSRILTTLLPDRVSAISVDGPYAATSPEQKAGTGFIELQYGAGGQSA